VAVAAVAAVAVAAVAAVAVAAVAAVAVAAAGGKYENILLINTRTLKGEENDTYGN
jgi:hypothetical protein